MKTRTDWDRRIVDECRWQYEDGIREANRNGGVNRVVDIGCHIGGFIHHIKTLFPDARVKGVEPDLENITLAYENVGKLPGVDLRYAFCGYSIHHAILKRDATNSGNTRVMDAGYKVYPGFGRLTLEDLITEPVDLLKIDCEGGEYDIFHHALPETLARIKVIIGEYHGERGDFITRIEPRLMRQFTVSYLPPFNPHLGFFMAVNHAA